MRAVQLLLGFRAAILTAIFASAALVIEYNEGGDPAFCGVQSACYKVRMSGVGQSIAQGLLDTFGAPISLPQLALFLFFILLFTSFFVRAKSTVQALAAFSTLGGLAAIFLLGTQIYIKELCFFCVVVDLAMLVAAGFALALVNKASASCDELATSTELPITGRWMLAATMVTVVPFLWGRYPVIPPLPASIQAMQVEGKLTVVSMTDFECPYCRKLNPHLAEIKKRDDVVFKRVMVPLDGHPGAMPAALAYVCAPDDRKDELAEHLYAAPSDQLTVPALLSKVRNMGWDARAMEDCMALGNTAIAIEKDKALFKEVGARGLPTTFVGRYPVLGFAPEKLRAAAGKSGSIPELPVWTMFIVAGLVIVWVSVSTHRVLRGKTVLSSEIPKKAPDVAPPEKPE